MLAQEYPVWLLCNLLVCAPSSYYCQSRGWDDTELRDVIAEIASEFTRYGYRHITAELGWRGHIVNHKRVLRIMREENLLVRVKRYVRTTLSQQEVGRYPNLIKDLGPEGPKHIWCGDITYIRVRMEFGYLAVLMDIFPRAIRGWHLSRNLAEESVRTALERGLVVYPAPRIHHSDRGIQYVAHGCVALLETHGTEISMAAVGRPMENALPNSSSAP